MIRIGFLLFAFFVGAFLLTQSVLAQTATPSPSPTTTVPSGAPATGFGQ